MALSGGRTAPLDIVPMRGWTEECDLCHLGMQLRADSSISGSDGGRGESDSDLGEPEEVRCGLFIHIMGYNGYIPHTLLEGECAST